MHNAATGFAVHESIGLQTKTRLESWVQPAVVTAAAAVYTPLCSHDVNCSTTTSNNRPSAHSFFVFCSLLWHERSILSNSQDIRLM
eukprot:6205449-Pleurochrysis_carterae.AAC.1